MRENTKWIMLITALAFVALMVFEWGMDITGRSALGLGEIGEVDGTPVMHEEYEATRRRIYDQVQQSQSEPITSQQSSQIEDRAWDEVVNQILIRQELARRGIEVSDEEVRQAARYSPPPWFRDEPAFLDEEGNFSLERYQQFLASQQGNQPFLLQLESYYRDVIPRSKLLRQVTSGIYVPDGELWRAYRDANESVEVRYVAMDPATRVADSLVTVSDAEIRAYYEEHREEFAIPARATVKVVGLSKAPTPADTAAALERAREVRGEILDGADFAEVARRESADSASAAEGGDLGTFGRGDMVPAFEEAAFDAPVGRVTEPVRSRFGYHLIRVDERWRDSVRARHVLIPIERTDDSELDLLVRADSLEDLGENVPLEEAAAELGVEARTVEITEAFPLAPGIGQVGEGIDWALEEASPGDVSPVFENDQAFYALELVSSEPGSYQSLEDATPTIRRILTLRKKIERAREEAAEIVGAARRQGDLGVAARRNLAVREAGPFTRIEFVQGLGRQNAAIGAAFGLEEGQVADPVEADNNVFILQLVNRTPADSAAWLAQKEEQRVRTIQTVQQRRLEQWLEGLRQRAEILDRRDEAFQRAEEQQGQGTGLPSLF